ncbi:hypothetical protein [Mariniluteicoccus flavus]
MELDGRLLVNDFVVCEFDHEVDEVVLAVFTREMAAAPSPDGLLGFEATGRVVADRLDALGHSADGALDLLDESLDLARSAYFGLHPDDPALIVSDPVGGLLTLEAEGWLRVFSEDRPTPPVAHSEWFMGLFQDHDAATVLRLAALARPDGVLRLEVDADEAFTKAELPRQLVITQTADDAEALRYAIQGRTPHLVDLVLASHLGGDGSAEALVEHVRGLARLKLLQPLTAVFRPDALVESMLLNERPDAFRVLVAPDVPLVDPPATLKALLTVVGIGVGPHLPRHRRATGGDAESAPADARPASD